MRHAILHAGQKWDRHFIGRGDPPMRVSVAKLVNAGAQILGGLWILQQMWSWPLA